MYSTCQPLSLCLITNIVLSKTTVTANDIAGNIRGAIVMNILTPHPESKIDKQPDAVKVAI